MILILSFHEGQKVSRPRWLVTYGDCLPAQRQLPVQVTTLIKANVLLQSQAITWLQQNLQGAVFTRDSIYAIARICYHPSVCQTGGSYENG